MIVTRKALSRRAVLRGMRAAVAPSPRLAPVITATLLRSSRSTSAPFDPCAAVQAARVRRP